MKKIQSWENREDKQRYKLVRTDDYTDIAGEIITADEETGECCLQVGGETKTLSYGGGGIRIVEKTKKDLSHGVA